MTPDNYMKLDRLKAFAEKHSRSLNELAHAWLLAQPQVSSVISGATSVEHVQANAATGDWVLAEQEIKEVNAILDE
jgi:aryl-alcohol dehydrogenase-like predicted oxidoreductase